MLWKQMRGDMSGEGQQKLWGWFGLDRASFLTMPRVLMHEMPDEWQDKMAALLKEYDDTFPGVYDLGLATRVHAASDGKYIKCPEWILRYRHPNKEDIDALRFRAPRHPIEERA